MPCTRRRAWAAKARAALLHPRLPWILAVLAMLLGASSLQVGWVADDLFHRTCFEESPRVPELTGSPMDQFKFATGDLEDNRMLRDRGFWPWWSTVDIKATFFRPITVATHWLDYALWPKTPALMHLQSVLWFGVLIAAVTVFYRRIAGVTLLAGLAALMYAVDDARGMPVGFLANRNALVAAVFGVLALIAHDRWRRNHWRAGAAVGPLLYAAALLSAEIGVGAVAYVIAHALFLDRGTWKRRLAVLAPYGLVLVVWRVVWIWADAGVHGLGLYVDPLAEPGRFLSSLPLRAAALLLGQLGLPPAEAQIAATDWQFETGYYVALIVILTPLLVLLLRHVTWNPVTRFWLAGLLLCLPPICATFPADRMLFFVGLGAFGLISQFLLAAWEAPRPRRPVRILAGTLAVIHLAIAPIVLAVRSAMPVGPRSMLSRVYLSVPDDWALEGRSVVVASSLTPLAAGYLIHLRDMAGLSVPAHIRVLAPYYPGSTEIRRSDERTLIVRPERGYLVLWGDRLCRGRQCPMRLGEQVELSDVTIEVTELTPDGRPAEARFRFNAPLEDDSLCWVNWGWDGYRPWTIPQIGETVCVGSGCDGEGR